MRRHRTRARGIFFAVLTTGLAAATLASPASSVPEAGVPRLVFPLVAKTLWWDNYGDPRPNGRHEGIDIEAPWRAPVVAVESGKVEHAESARGGCMLYLYGRSGTTYVYIHLNDDLTARFDGKGGCVPDVAFAVPNGARVSTGEQIAWNGDSGDAVGNHHLHFEVHPGGGGATNPFKHLTRATRPLFAARPGTVFSLGLRGAVVSIDPDAVTLETTRVRHYPGGRWTEIDARTVELSVPRDASTAVGGLGDLKLRSGTPKTPLTVAAYTAKMKATIDTIVGAPGALRLSRVAPVP